ncbi:LysE family transporter, partial [Salmonella enterica subsp. enterica serovar Kentucky]|nr:LysE family transporter [Salmonella enterica subsp. enterica serovar Kentucky]
MILGYRLHQYSVTHDVCNWLQSVASHCVLISAGIFGGSALLMQSPWLLALVTWGGVAFLLWYGFGALKT